MGLRTLMLWFVAVLLLASCRTPNEDPSQVKDLDVSKADEDIEVIAIDNAGKTEHCILLGGYPELGQEWEKKLFDSKKQRKLCDYASTKAIRAMPFVQSLTVLIQQSRSWISLDLALAGLITKT